MKKSELVFITGILFFILTGCFDNQPVAGGTETETTITGMVLDTNGQPVNNVYASLAKYDYNPVANEELTEIKRTDIKGEFSFEGVTGGIYNLQFTDPDAGTAALIREFVVEVGKEFDPLHAILKRQSQVRIYFENSTAEAGDYVYIPGTDKFANIDSLALAEGTLTLTGIPPATYSAINIAGESDSTGTNILQANLAVIPAGTAVVGPYGTWRYSTRVFINTTTSGADVTDDVAGFPLLVRVRSGGLDFSQVAAKGKDLRFSKSDGTPLHYEIELWDLASETLDVWVRLDTVYGNDDTQFMQMHWGNTASEDRSRSEEVFDTDRNFASAWHLGGSLLDATSNNNDGTNFNSIVVPGVIGEARSFQAQSNLINFGNDVSLKNISESIAVSCWLKTATVNDSLTNNVSVIRHDGHYTGLQVSFQAPNAWVVAWTPDRNIQAFTWDSVFNDNVWHHYVSMYNMNTGLRVYKDGVLYHVSSRVQGPLATNTIDDFILGGSEDGWEYYNGMLDEVRVSSSLRSDAWIKLSYESQKPNASAITIEP